MGYHPPRSAPGAAIGPPKEVRHNHRIDHDGCAQLLRRPRLSCMPCVRRCTSARGTDTRRPAKSQPESPHWSGDGQPAMRTRRVAAPDTAHPTTSHDPRGTMVVVSDPPRSARHVRHEWAALNSLPSSDAVFDPSRMANLPMPVRKWLQHSIRKATPLARTAWLRMRGHIRIGAWRPFTATQVFAPGVGFIWAATAKFAGVRSALRASAPNLTAMLPAAESDASRRIAAQRRFPSLWSSGRRFGPMPGAPLRPAVEHGCEVEKRRPAVDVPPCERVRDCRREERRAGWGNDFPSVYCLAMAMFTRSSGLIRWSRLSSPMSILTQAMSPG